MESNDLKVNKVCPFPFTLLIFSFLSDNNKLLKPMTEQNRTYQRTNLLQQTKVEDEEEEDEWDPCSPPLPDQAFLLFFLLLLLHFLPLPCFLPRSNLLC